MEWEEFKTLLDYVCTYSSDLLWISTADMSADIYVSTGFEEQLGATRTELAEQNGTTAVHSADRSAQQKLCTLLAEWGREDEIREGFDPIKNEFRVVTAKQQRTWFTESIFPVTDESKTVRYWGGIIRNTTESKHRLESYKTQAETLAKLNQITRHDIRNEALLGMTMLRTLSDENYSGTELREQLIEVFSRMTAFTEAIRDVTNVVAELSKPTYPVSLEEVLHREIAVVSTQYDTATISVDESLFATTVAATANLSVVFKNILENAIEHNTHHSPQIDISRTLTEHHILIHIADNGPGIPNEQKERIFEMGETCRESTGVGFGLPLVECVVQSFSGAVYLTDNTPTGSVFTVRLPRSDT